MSVLIVVGYVGYLVGYVGFDDGYVGFHDDYVGFHVGCEISVLDFRGDGSRLERRREKGQEGRGTGVYIDDPPGYYKK